MTGVSLVSGVCSTRRFDRDAAAPYKARSTKAASSRYQMICKMKKIQKAMPGRDHGLAGGECARFVGCLCNSHLVMTMMKLTKVMGVKKKLKTATAAVDIRCDSIWVMIPKTIARIKTVMPLNCARLKKAAPKMLKDARAKPARR